MNVNKKAKRMLYVKSRGLDRLPMNAPCRFKRKGVKQMAIFRGVVPSTYKVRVLFENQILTIEPHLVNVVR